MSPLKSQVSFSKDRNFSFLRRSESLKEKKDARQEAENGKESRPKSKDRNRNSSKDKTKEGSTPNLESHCPEGRFSHQGTSFAASLAATLSPFSSFVTSHSPRLPRRGSPSPGRQPNFDASLDTSSFVKSTNSVKSPYSVPSPNSVNNDKNKKFNSNFLYNCSPEQVRRKLVKGDAHNKKVTEKPMRTKSLTLNIPKTSLGVDDYKSQWLHSLLNYDYAKSGPSPAACLSRVNDQSSQCDYSKSGPSPAACLSRVNDQSSQCDYSKSGPSPAACLSRVNDQSSHCDYSKSGPSPAAGLSRVNDQSSQTEPEAFLSRRKEFLLTKRRARRKAPNLTINCHYHPNEHSLLNLAGNAISEESSGSGGSQRGKDYGCEHKHKTVKSDHSLESRTGEDHWDPVPVLWQHNDGQDTSQHVEKHR